MKPAESNVRAFAFAHGTTLESARHIIIDGLNVTVAKQLSTGGVGNRPGYFHTFELGPPDRPGEGLQAAYDMGLRHTSTPVILILLLPKLVYNELVARGLVLIEPLLGLLDLPQTVFAPGAFDDINQQGVWRIVDPFQREGMSK